MLKYIIACLTLFFLSGCATPIIVGAAAGSATGGGLYLAQRHGADKTLIENVLMAYNEDTRLQNLRLDVDAENGIVKIYGFVPTRQDEERAMMVAGKVNGVKEVISRITILPPRLM